MSAVTRTRLAADLTGLGVRPGGVLMVHTRMSALGWVVGAAETVVRALLDAVGPDGTLMAYASWEEHRYRPEEWPAEHRDAYLAEPPVFDPATGEIDRSYGRVPERIRTWPGALRSTHPEAGVVALGLRAAWLTRDHPADDSYGPESPFARLVEARGDVLLLGAPLHTTTLLHHAEAIARVPGKRRITSTVAVQDGDRVVPTTSTDIDTAGGAFDDGKLQLDDLFAVVVREALAAGIGRRGRVGEGDSVLLPAAELTSFAVAWFEERFGDSGGRQEG